VIMIYGPMAIVGALSPLSSASPPCTPTPGRVAHHGRPHHQARASDSEFRPRTPLNEGWTAVGDRDVGPDSGCDRCMMGRRRDGDRADQAIFGLLGWRGGEPVSRAVGGCRGQSIRTLFTMFVMPAVYGGCATTRANDDLAAEARNRGHSIGLMAPADLRDGRMKA